MKKKILAGLLSAMMVVSLAACGSSETGATATESKSETTANTADGTAAAATDAQGGYEGKEVKVWISSGAEDDIYREMFDKIEGDLNITITDEYYSKDELDNKMQTSSIAGDMPDAVVADYLLIPKYYEAGLVANLDDYVTDELMDDYLPSVVAECTYNDHIISVAQFDSGLAFWANKSMLENAGVRIPADYKDAWDKAEFEDALKKLKDSGVEWPIYVRDRTLHRNPGRR